MAGKFGVTSTKKLISLAKVGVISVLQGIAKDGYQVADLLAPVKSDTFLDALKEAAADFATALPEVMELDFFDGIELTKHVSGCWKDIRTEWKLAANKVKESK